MPGYIGNKKIKEFYVGNKRVKMIYLGDILKYQYDNIVPDLSTSCPDGLSSSQPTYTSTNLFMVLGTISDSESGVSAVYVNGSPAIINEDIWYSTITLEKDVITEVSIYAVDNAGNRTEIIKRYVIYVDSVPTLTVANPTGTSDSPTYYNASSSSTISYTVSGTVSDTYGVASVTVNGVDATISGNDWIAKLSLDSDMTHAITVIATNKAGATTTITRYLLVVSNSTNVTQTMAYVFTGTGGSATSLQGSNVTSVKAEGTGWQDSNHELVISYAVECVPTSITFTTPTIVNTGQASSVTYSMWGSNSIYNGTLSNMEWTQLVSNATWSQSSQGGETKTLSIPSNGKIYKHIRMVSTWFYGANGYHGVLYGGLYTKGYPLSSSSSLDESIIYNSGKLQDGINITKLVSTGSVAEESSAIYMDSNPNSETILQPYAAIGMYLSGYSKYQNINVDYKDWSQTGSTSNARFAVCNDLQIDLGSTNRTWKNTINSAYATSSSGTIKMPWTDSKYLGIGAFSQSNQNSKLRVTKIYFSDSTMTPFNEALLLVGISSMSSISDVLSSESACTALSKNVKAVNIMKSNYSSDITSAITSNWNAGLNVLAYQCKLKCYIIKDRVGVNNFHSTTNGMYLSSNSNNGDSYMYGTTSSNPIEIKGFTSALVSGYAKSDYGGTASFGLSLNKSVGSNSYYDLWYKNQSRCTVTATSSGNTFTNQSFSLVDASYIYPLIMLQLPLSNGYTQSGTAYIKDFLLVP